MTFSGNEEVLFALLIDDGVDERLADVIAFGISPEAARARALKGWQTRRGGATAAKEPNKENEFWNASASRERIDNQKPGEGVRNVFGPPPTKTEKEQKQKDQAVEQVTKKIAGQMPSIASRPGMMERIKKAAGQAIDAGIYAAKAVGSRVGAAAKVAGASALEGVKEGVGASTKIVGGIGGGMGAAGTAVGAGSFIGPAIIPLAMLESDRDVSAAGQMLESVIRGGYTVGHAIGAAAGSPIGAAVGGTVGAIKGVGKGIKALVTGGA